MARTIGAETSRVKGQRNTLQKPRCEKLVEK